MDKVGAKYKYVPILNIENSEIVKNIILFFFKF